MTTHHPLTLAVDCGSPVASLALGSGNLLLAEKSYAGGPASPPLLAQLDDLLSSAGCRIRDVEALIGARGPGSFTGLRAGLATLVALHQALGIQATAVPSFLPLAAQLPDSVVTVAAVDALRGEWFVQVFDPHTRHLNGPPRIVSPRALLDYAPCSVIAFKSDALRAELADRPDVEVREAVPLARGLLQIAAAGDLSWDPAPLIAPLYLRPAAAQRGL